MDSKPRGGGSECRGGDGPECGSGGDAGDEGVGQAIGEKGLHDCACHGEIGSDEQGEEQSGQAELEQDKHGGILRGCRTAERREHLVHGNPAGGADLKGHPRAPDEQDYRAQKPGSDRHGHF
ncbi:MAG: hypothetical protein RLZZ142_2699 [Verrucomicrobiota bacterium]